jgi:hypothetical protein
LGIVASGENAEQHSKSRESGLAPAESVSECRD